MAKNLTVVNRKFWPAISKACQDGAEPVVVALGAFNQHVVSKVSGTAARRLWQTVTGSDKPPSAMRNREGLVVPPHLVSGVPKKYVLSFS